MPATNVTASNFPSLDLAIQIVLVILTFIIALLTFLSLSRSTLYYCYPRLKKEVVYPQNPEDLIERLRDHGTIVKAARLPTSGSSYPVDYFDLNICNTGPAVAKNVNWEIKGEITISGNKTELVCSGTLKILQPQACEIVLGYLDPSKEYTVTLETTTSVLKKHRKEAYPMNRKVP